MIARFTTTGLQMIPYKVKQCKPILVSRSVYMPSIHRLEAITAHVVADQDGKRLCTYHSSKDWLNTNCPEYKIEVLPPNHVERIQAGFELNMDIIPNEIQSSAVQATIENNFKTAFFNIPTGDGKTLMAVYLMSLLKVKGWAMCYRTTVLKQWVRTLRDMTTIDISRVRVVDSSAELYRMATGNYDTSRYDFYLSTPMLLTMFAERYGMDLLNDAMDFCGIGVKFFDEAHKNVGNICKINALTNIARTYYLSADFGQPSKDRAQLYYKMFGNIPIIKPIESIVADKKYTVAILARYNTNPSINQVSSVFTKYGFNHFRFMDHQISCPEFYDVLEKLLTSFYQTNKEASQPYRTLVLCNLIRHVDILRDHIEKFTKELYTDMRQPKVVRYHSQMPEDEKEEGLRTGDIIVSTYQSMGVGIDLKWIRYIISMAPINIIDDNQAAGRARALPDGADCFYVMMVDDGFEYVRNKLPARLSYLSQQKIKKSFSIKYN